VGGDVPDSSISVPDNSFSDLEIRILQKLPEGYPVEITLGGQREFPRGYLSSDITPWQASGDLSADGQRLFEQLMMDARVRSAWIEARGSAPQRRIRIRIDADAPELHTLPWEMLQDGTRWLSASADTPFSRYLPIALPWGSVVGERPIKVLIVISNPSDLDVRYGLPQVDLQLEEEILTDAFTSASKKDVQVDYLDAPATLERLERALRQGYHVLHFLGHGAYNVRRKQAAVYLQNDDGMAQRAIDDDLANMLARQGVQPRLIVLAACQSASRSTGDAFAGLGPKLVSIGVPAVVAMQDVITVKSARQFSAIFYRRILEHGQVDRATNEARSTLLTTARPDAAVPVVFMRVKSGRLWGEEPAPTLPNIPAPPAPACPPEISDFVGRSTEIERYLAQLAQRHLVVISGMRGVGKTALAARLFHEHARAFWHSFHETESVTGLQWKLAGFLAYHGQADLWQMLQRAQQTGGQPPPPAVLFEYLAHMLPGHDFVLYLDDVQYISDDPLLEEFFVSLKPAITAGKLSLVIISQSVPEFIDVTEDRLGGLSLADTRQLLARNQLDIADSVAAPHSAASTAWLTDDILMSLHARTEGNALLLTLAVDGLKRAADPARFLDNLFADANIERFLIKEIDDKLSEDERAVMTAIAVLLGYGATREVIEIVLNGANVRRTLSELSLRNLLTVTASETGREYTINTVIREFYYDWLSKRQRQEMHRRAGAYYETEEPDLLRAALHFQRAGEIERAAHLATNDIWTVINRGEARPLLELLDRFRREQLSSDLWIKVNLARGDLHTLGRNSKTAHHAYETALAILDDLYPIDSPHFYSTHAESPEPLTLRARAYRGLGALLEYEAPREALSWLQRGLKLVAEVSTYEEAILRIRVGSVQLGMGGFAEAQSETEQGLKLLPARPDHWRAVALMNLGIIHSKRGEPQQATDLYQQALHIYQQIDDYWGLIPVQLDLGFELMQAGHWPQAAEKFQAALELADRLGAANWQVTLELAFGIIQTRMGSDDLAEAHLRRCINLARERNLVEYLIAGLSSLSDWHIRREEWAAAERAIDEAEPLAMQMEARDQLPELYRGRALIHLAHGQLAEAKSMAEKVINLCRELELKVDEGMSWRILAQILVAQPLPDQTWQAFEQSLTLVRGDVYEVARTQLEWSRALRASDLDRARELLQAARSTFERLGAERDRAACDAG
jgi:tetratricopeptide (TPR) repeat protein